MLSAEDDGRDLRVQWLFDSDSSAGILDPLRSGAAEAFPQIVDYIASIVVPIYGEGLKYAPGKPLPLDPPDRPTRLQGFFNQMKGLFSSEYGTENQFLQQDIQVYPIIFGTSLGEFEPIEIFRISPEDTRPIADTAPPACQENPPLRGASLDAFGAFLDQDWRMSDMLRGRLDGAERLITAVLPDSDEKTCEVREDLIRRAQEEIAKEWVAFRNGLNLRPSDQKLKLIHELKEYKEMRGPKPKWFTCDDLGRARKEESMKAARVPRRLSVPAQKVIAEVYLVGSVPADPYVVLQDISRSVSIVGRLLNGLTDRYATPGKSAANVVTIAGSVLWAIVEISVPGRSSSISRETGSSGCGCRCAHHCSGAVTNTSGMPSVESTPCCRLSGKHPLQPIAPVYEHRRCRREAHEDGLGRPRRFVCNCRHALPAACACTEYREYIAVDCGRV